MPFPIDAVGWTPRPTNDLVQSVGFSRSPSVQAGPSVLGTGADSREATFGSILSNAVENMQNRHQKAQELGVKAVTGRLEDVHDYTIAASESKLTIELTSTLRNKTVEAFNEIMRMQA